MLFLLSDGGGPRLQIRPLPSTPDIQSEDNRYYRGNRNRRNGDGPHGYVQPPNQRALRPHLHSYTSNGHPNQHRNSGQHARMNESHSHRQSQQHQQQQRSQQWPSRSQPSQNQHHQHHEQQQQQQTQQHRQSKSSQPRSRNRERRTRAGAQPRTKSPRPSPVQQQHYSFNSSPSTKSNPVPAPRPFSSSSPTPPKHGSQHEQQAPTDEDRNKSQNKDRGGGKIQTLPDENSNTDTCSVVDLEFDLKFYCVNEHIGSMKISEQAVKHMSYKTFCAQVVELLVQQGKDAIAKVVNDHKLGKVAMMIVSFWDTEIEIEDMDDVVEQIESTKLDDNDNVVAFSVKFVATGDEKTEEKDSFLDNNKNVKNTNANKIGHDQECTVEYFLKKKKNYVLRNPFVIVIGIENYGKTSYVTLDGIGWDVYRMAHLWHDIYKYNDMSLVFRSSSENDNTIGDKLGKYKKYFNYPIKAHDSDIMKEKQTFRDYLVKIRSEIERNERNDGLVLYYSGHGIKDCIILSNGKSFPIQEIINIFDGEQCVQLRNKPKIMIYDCCRGGKASQTFLNECEYKENNQNEKMMKTKGNHWYDNMYHVNSGLATIFANFAGYAVNDTSVGGHLTRSIEKIFENPKLIQQESLRDLIVGIRDLTKISAGKGDSSIHWSAQLVDFHETLEYKVYFRPNA